MSTWSDVKAYINTQLKPGVLGATNVQKILNSILAVVNQISAGALDPQNESLWKSDISYAQDVKPVLWMDTWLVSNIENNLGNVPISNSGVVHPSWRKINSSPGSGIRVWEPIVYPNILEVVFFQGGLYYLDRNEVGMDPYVSVDFEDELVQGIWVTLVKSLTTTATDAVWENNNPVLALGEFGYATDSRKLKIGDGVNNWNDLPAIVTPGPGTSLDDEGRIQLGKNKQYHHLIDIREFINGTLLIGHDQETIDDLPFGFFHVSDLMSFIGLLSKTDDPETPMATESRMGIHQVEAWNNEVIATFFLSQKDGTSFEARLDRHGFLYLNPDPDNLTDNHLIYKGYLDLKLLRFVRHDISDQGLNSTERQNARTNIQAVSKDTNETRVGTLDNTGLIIVRGGGEGGVNNIAQLNGDLLYIRTAEDGTASALMLDIRNGINLGGVTTQKRGSTTIRARGDSVTGYFILKLQNNNATPTDVFAVLGTDGYTEIGRAAAISSNVLLNVFGKIKHEPATNANESATLGQLNAIINTLNHFRGLFTSLAALEAEVFDPPLVSGDYAKVDEGVGFDVIKYIWDASDEKWVPGGVANDFFTDEGTFLQAGKPVREGAGADSKYQTKAEVDEKVGDIPLINPDNFGVDGDGKMVVKSNSIERSGTTVRFDVFATGKMGKFFEPITEEIGLSVTGGVEENKCSVYMSLATVPELIQNAITNASVTDPENENYSVLKIKLGEFLTGIENVNRLIFEFIDPLRVEVEIISYPNVFGTPLEDIVEGLIVYAPLDYVSANPTSYPNKVSNSITIDVISPESGVDSISAPNGGLASMFTGGSSLRINANAALESLTTEFYMAFWARPSWIGANTFIDCLEGFTKPGFRIDTTSGGQGRFWYQPTSSGDTTKRVTQNDAFVAERWDFFEFTHDGALGSNRLKILRNRSTLSQAAGEAGLTLDMTGLDILIQGGLDTAYKNIIIANKIPSTEVRDQLFQLV